MALLQAAEPTNGPPQQHEPIDAASFLFGDGKASDAAMEGDVDADEFDVVVLETECEMRGPDASASSGGDYKCDPCGSLKGSGPKQVRSISTGTQMWTLFFMLPSEDLVPSLCQVACALLLPASHPATWR